MMDDQTLVNWGLAGLGAAGGWILKVIWDAVGNLRTDLRQIERDLPDVYVRKENFQEAVAAMKTDIRDLRTDIRDNFRQLDAKMGTVIALSRVKRAAEEKGDQ